MSKIKTYEDLLQEEQRLKLKIAEHEILIRQDLVAMGESLKPVGRVYNFVKKIMTRDHTGPLANFGIDFGVDMLIRRLILARAGWFTKIVVPYVIKNYSSHIINEEQRAKISQLIQKFVNKFRSKKSASSSGTSAAV